MANPFHLVVDNVDKRFNTKQGEFIAIRDINLRVQRGEFTALIGHSGCGKSTLLNLIAGLDVATSGVLVSAGCEISGPGQIAVWRFRTIRCCRGSLALTTFTSLSNEFSPRRKRSRNSSHAPKPHSKWWVSPTPLTSIRTKFPAA